MSENKTIGILAVQGGFAEHAAAVERLGHTARLVRKPDHVPGLDGIIFPGGESTTMSKLLRLGGLIDPLSDALEGGLPAFGTCAGLIMLAENVVDTRPDAFSFGALDITVRRNAFGRQKESFETRLPVEGVAEDVEAVFIRAPQVESVGDGVTVLSSLSDDTVVAVQQGNVMGCSFHPELTEDLRLHEYFIGLIDNR
ncbi:MAG TPA: pyridoxal 5'-phosphate synthase glutaminase subunit PdxT [Candidatus Corynebacterium gallistercoris]|uniref:Pyridoxal 5'-phosphate synthase subunit PdxT n=1 Tax=Candidatus Corynebacterium gallistercoris TaxID=2838530 RepID=A0A9D1RXE6_9CORY|nr:pyridoxal 5'-phosphate synthase glutaminase subunit PdxT [Candidatus Corynebacterium gallistercoris]